MLRTSYPSWALCAPLAMSPTQSGAMHAHAAAPTSTNTRTHSTHPSHAVLFAVTECCGPLKQDATCRHHGDRHHQQRLTLPHNLGLRCDAKLELLFTLARTMVAHAAHTSTRTRTHSTHTRTRVRTNTDTHARAHTRARTSTHTDTDARAHAPASLTRLTPSAHRSIHILFSLQGRSTR